MTISEARRMNEAIFEWLSRPRPPRYWRPEGRIDYARAGKAWHALLGVPRLTPDGEDFAGWLRVRGTGRTRKAAHSALRHQLNRHGGIYRLALTVDLERIFRDTVNDWTRRKMKEDGLFRRIMPPGPVDHAGRVLKKAFAGWGPDGKATFKMVAVDRDGKHHEPVRHTWAGLAAGTTGRIRVTDAGLDAALAADPPVKRVD